jgi:hypothetical protein
MINLCKPSVILITCIQQVAGRDTTAQGISWMMYLLLRKETDPEILETFIREVDETYGDNLPTFETHKKQKFAEAWYTIKLYFVLFLGIRHCFLSLCGLTIVYFFSRHITYS